MKYIFFFLFLVSCTSTKHTRKTHNPYVGITNIDTIFLSHSYDTTGSFSFVPNVIKYAVYDTVKCLLVVSDTSIHIYDGAFGHKDTAYNAAVLQIQGYDVRVLVQASEIGRLGNVYQHRYYLDINKKPLLHLFAWMSIIIDQ